MDMTVSVFQNFSAPGKEVPLEYVFEKIRKGGDFVASIDTIRELTKENPDAAQELKRKLPGITFCGVFKKRDTKNLIKSTGLVILDFDDAPDGLSDQLKANPFIYALWVSPRGQGYKALVKIPQVKDDNEFKSYFFAIQNEFDDVDPSGKDISRFCFMSYDPDLYVNENAQVWTKAIDQGTKGVKDIPGIHKVNTNWKKMTAGLQMVENADVGNRNNTILKAGKLIGGYIATGEINELDVLDVFSNAIYRKDSADYKENFRTFKRGIEYGKADPIESTAIISEEKIGKIYYQIEETYNKLDDIYENGLTKGYSVGWDHFDDYYSLRLGFTTYIYGAPFTGKTKWWFNALVNLSIKHGLKHVIYSPETGDAGDVYSMLCQIYAGGDITKTFNNRINRVEYNNARDFIGTHFMVISTDETDSELTPTELLEYIDVIEKKFNTKIHTVTIDPWNELDHDDSREGHIYLNKQLKRVRVMAKKSDRHVAILTHIRDQKPLGFDKYGVPIYPFPSARDVADGQVWYRKGFMMLAFYRHFVTGEEDVVELNKNGWVFHRNALLIGVQKSKPEGVGKLGRIEFRYDARSHRFSDQWGKFPNMRLVKEEVNEEIPF